MKRCSACGKQIRSGTMIYASDGKGGLARKRVGKCCAQLAVPLLIGSIEASRCKCGSPATSCTACARDADKSEPGKVLAGALKKLRGLVRSYNLNEGGGETQGSPEYCSYEGRTEGLEMAISLLEAGGY